MLIEILVDVWLIEAMLIRNFIKRNIFHFIKKIANGISDDLIFFAIFVSRHPLFRCQK